MEERQTEQHPWGFFLPENARVLMLGSFPPPRRRWSMDFYYPNIQNDMWRIIGWIFFRDKNYFLIPSGKGFDEPRVRAFCTEKGIALGDTAMEVYRQRGNASDKDLEVIRPFSPAEVFPRIPCCRSVVVTGQKAMDTFRSVIPAMEPPVGGYAPFTYDGQEYRLFRMPSSSRAYPKPVEEKAESYRSMFELIGILE